MCVDDDDIVQVLRNAGEEVTLTVSFLKRAPAFLKLPLNEDCACAPSDQSSGTSSPLCDSGLHLNYHPNNTDTLSCSSWPACPGLRWEKRWCDLRLIPLLHCRFSQYVPGTDLSRQNAFQVTAVDGVCSGTLQCLSAEDCNQNRGTRHAGGSRNWFQGGRAEAARKPKQRKREGQPGLCRARVPCRHVLALCVTDLAYLVVCMGWCEAREPDPIQDRAYSPAFLALRGSCLYRFLAPPDSDLLDRRKHCFSVQSESGEDLYFSVELESDLAQWERAFQTAAFLEVERIQCKTYACVLDGHLMGLTIDFSSGFICFDAATKAVLWRYKFSQLKGSSDDGKSKIKFLFQNSDTKQIEAKELEFSNLFAVLHCIHSFFAAKVACLDPFFLGSQAAASAASSSGLTGKAKYQTPCTWPQLAVLMAGVQVGKVRVVKRVVFPPYAFVVLPPAVTEKPVTRTTALRGLQRTFTGRINEEIGQRRLECAGELKQAVEKRPYVTRRNLSELDGPQKRNRTCLRRCTCQAPTAPFRPAGLLTSDPGFTCVLSVLSLSLPLSGGLKFSKLSSGKQGNYQNRINSVPLKIPRLHTPDSLPSNVSGCGGVLAVSPPIGVHLLTVLPTLCGQLSPTCYQGTIVEVMLR
ncbi:gamma-1-syntrophin [Camelus ferus]|nr:gamma-1-syntrophin [Camelus ferus]